VGVKQAPAQSSCRSDGEHARPSADIEDAVGPIRLDEAIERQQAAARGAMMARAESERRLDFDAHHIRSNPRSVMRAVNDEASGRDRMQSGEACGDPVALGNARESERACRLLTRDLADEGAQPGLIA